MTIPVYNLNELPCITYPMVCTQESTKKYLGGSAITGKIYADINTISKSNEEQYALYSFWKDTCNHGLEPFLMPLPVFGEMASARFPAMFVRFMGDIKSTMKENVWENKFKLEVIATTRYNIDNVGSFVVTTVDDLILDGQGDYVATNIELNSYKEIIWQ